MVYIIAFIAALIAAFLDKRMTPTLRKSILIIICVYVILIFGFRYKVGVDTISYMYGFRKIPTIDHLFSVREQTVSRYEPGFLLICSICKTITKEFWLVQIVMASITNGCVFLFLYRYCKNVFIGVLFYFVFLCPYFTTEIMRESAAIGIFLLNFRNLEKGRWIRYYLFSILSIMFHYSAVVIWFFPLARILRPNILFYALCLIFLGITPLVERLNEILHIAAIYNRIDMYTSGADDLNFNWRLAELAKSAFPAIATMIGYYVARKKPEFRYMILLQILLCMGAFAIPLIFSRFANYTRMFVIIAAANLIMVPTLKRWVTIAFVSFMLLTQVQYYYTFYKIWVPYSSIFYPQENPDRMVIYRSQFMQWKKDIKFKR